LSFSRCTLQSADIDDVDTNAPTIDELWQGWLTSLVFWVCLFLAAGLYATVTLSPKLLASVALEREYLANQWRLVELDRQVSHLERVIEAQTHDPAFVREQARSAFDVASPDEQRIPVDAHFRLNIEVAAPEIPAAPRILPWYTPLLALVARSHVVGNALLGTAGALVLYAFTFLHDGRRAFSR
jgi:hypothetical protein